MKIKYERQEKSEIGYKTERRGKRHLRMIMKVGPKKVIKHIPDREGVKSERHS